MEQKPDSSALRASIRSPVRPRNRYAIESEVRNHLTHVFMGVGREAQIDASDGCFFAKEVQVSAEFGVAGFIERLIYDLQ